MTKWNTGKIKTFTRTYVTKWFYLWNPNIPHNLLCYCLCDCLIHLYLSHEIIKNEQLNSGSSNQFMIPFLCPFGTHTLFKALLSFHPFHIGFLTTETIFSLPLLSTLHMNLGRYFVPKEFSLMGLNPVLVKKKNRRISGFFFQNFLLTTQL